MSREKDISMIKNVKVNYNPEQNDLTFGHKLEISFDLIDCNYEDLEFHWYEKADAQYYIGKQDNNMTNCIGKWADLYEAAKSYSEVFEDLLVETDENRNVNCIDHPYIKLAPNNHRILEFFIVIKDNDNTVVIKARQELAVSEDNIVEVQNFTYEIFEDANMLIVPSENEEEYYNAFDF